MVKSVLSTFSITVVTMLFVVKLFFSSMLGFLGYATLPLEQFQKLKASQQVVNKLKANHKAKKVKVTKRFFKRTGKKVGATAISAATIGTVAVVGTLTYIEINEYCEDKNTLIEEENILFNKSDVFDFDACVEEVKSDSSKITQEAWLMVKQSSDDMVESLDDVLAPTRKELIKLFETIDKYFNN